MFCKKVLFKSSFNFRFIVMASVAAMLCGCQRSQLPEFAVGETPNAGKNIPMYCYTAGYSVEGRKIDYYVIGSGDDVVFFLATIHGNEPAGTPIARRLIMYLQDKAEIMAGRKVIVMPIANPDGFVHNLRQNANGVDLNRNFEAANRINNATNGPGGLSEPESRAIKLIIDLYKPDRIISFHQPLNCIDYDGPGEGISRRMGLYCDLPVKKLGSRPGSLGSYAGVTLGIPIITVEFLDSDTFLSDAQLWDKYGKMTLAALVYPDTVNCQFPAK